MNAKSVLSLIFTVILLLALASAYPRTRTVKDHRRSYGRLENALRSRLPSCDDDIPCGWALYSQDYSSTLRTTFQYSKNNFCTCSRDTVCAYKENRSHMRAYVFYCQRDDGTQTLHKFPN